jgi:uroporphyrinogen-III synthase
VDPQLAHDATPVPALRQAGLPALRVLVTRPERDARQWVEQLQHSGFEAEALPLIEIAPACGAANRQALRQAWDALADYAACLFVSGHAVEHFFKANPALAQAQVAQELAQASVSAQASAALETLPNHAASSKASSKRDDCLDLPPGLRLMAPGPGTVAALRAAGVPAAQIDAPAPDAGQFDSEALWQVIGSRDWQGRRVLIVRGHSAGAQGASSGRDWITRQWQAAGAQVDFVGVYQRQAPQLSDAQLQRVRAASADGSVWLFSSSEALAHLLRAAGLQGVDWRRARAVATHPRIEEAVRAAGWGVVVASRPALADIRTALASLESQHP